MSKRYYKSMNLLLLVLITLLSLSVLSAQDLQTQDNDEIEISNTEINLEDNLETSSIKKNMKESTDDNSIENYEKEENKKEKENSSDDNLQQSEGDCSSTIIQKNENETAISFRLDSGAKLNLYITNNTVVKQFKTQATYFFHVMMTPNGWVVGTGGSDSGTQNKKIEELAMRMINNNDIDAQTVNEIFDIKRNIGRGHFIIKAPNGKYAAIQYFYGKYTKEIGVLKSGEYIVCPNDPKYYRKGNYLSYTGTTNLSDATRFIAARDRYGTLRSQITTFEYVNKNHQRSISVYLANDDGRYVGCNSKRYCNDFNVSGKIIKSGQIPVINNKLHVATYKYRDKNTKTSTTTQPITTTTPKITLTANVTDDLSNRVNEGKVIFKVNGQTLKDAKGNIIKVKLVNGTARYNYTLPYIWRNNFTYTAKYIPTQFYATSTSKDSLITTKLIKAKLVVNSSYSNMMRITTNVTYIANDTKVNGGYFIYKINGVTLKDENNRIIKSAVVNGVSTLTINKRYSPNNYTLTLSYIRSNYRQDLKKEFRVSPIGIRIIMNPVTANSLHARINGRILDAYNNTTIGTIKACVKINGLTLKDSKNQVILFDIKNGIIKFDIKLPENLKARTYNLTIQTQQQNAYKSTTARTTLTLEKAKE